MTALVEHQNSVCGIKNHLPVLEPEKQQHLTTIEVTEITTLKSSYFF